MRAFHIRRHKKIQPRTERSLEQMTFRDDFHRYKLKTSASFFDPNLALLLHRIADGRLPRLFGRTGEWSDETSPLFVLPYVEPASIGLDQFPGIAQLALLVFEYVDGILLSELDTFSVHDAIRLHASFHHLRRCLHDIVGQAVLHLDLKPSNCLKLADGSFCFIDWASGRLGEGKQIHPEGTKGYVRQENGGLATSARDDAAMVQTMLSLLCDKPAKTMNFIDRFITFHRFPSSVRSCLKQEWKGGYTQGHQQINHRLTYREQTDDYGNLIGLEMSQVDKKNKGNLRISLDQ